MKKVITAILFIPLSVILFAIALPAFFFCLVAATNYEEFVAYTDNTGNFLTSPLIWLLEWSW